MRVGKWIALTAGALFLALAFQAPAFARPRVFFGVGVGPRVYHPYYYWRPAFAAPLWYGPAYWGPDYVWYGSRAIVGKPANYGEVKFDVRPKSAQVFVDGKYMGIVDDFDGHPQKAVLSAGEHDIRVVAPDGRSDERHIYIAPGRVFKYELRF